MKTKSNRKRNVYLDYAATTPTDPAVLKAMLPYFNKNFGNPSSMHLYGLKAAKALQTSRQMIAQAIGAGDEEIIFTSSATESANLAIVGAAFANKDKGNHIIVSAIEHDCVLNTASWLEKQGYEVTQLPVDKDGIIDPYQLKK